MKSRRYAKCRTIREVRALNKAQGYNFFSPDTLQFFNSVVTEDVFGGCVFVTSEKNGCFPRLYTVRAIRANGRIETLSDFQEYESLSDALRAAQEHGSKIANS